MNEPWSVVAHCPPNDCPLRSTFKSDYGMSLFVPPRRFDPNHPELMDQPGVDRALLREELQTLERFNQRLGGHRLVLHYMKRFVGSTESASLSILDLGTGAADIPRAIVTWARQRQMSIIITAVDDNPDILQIAQESCRSWPEIRFERHDLRALPYAGESFDLVLCSLALHHFDSLDAITILRRIQAVARRGYIVSDLCRNWLTIWSTELFARTLIRSPIFRNDALLSCRAAFTTRELWAMAGHAGLNDFQIKHHHALHRMVLQGNK